MLATKTCSKCNTIKAISDFPKRNNRKSGLQSQCKTCLNKQSKSIYSSESTPFEKERKERRTLALRHNSLRRSAIKRGIEFNLSIKDVQTIYAEIDKPCRYCNQSIQRASIDRINNKLGYVLENCVLVCSPCNVIKSNATPQQIKAIYFQIFGNILPNEIL